MKLLLFALLLCFLPSCAAFRDLAKNEARQLWNEELKPAVEEKITAKIAEKSPALVAQLDTNKNGKVELSEIKGLDVKDPQLWIIIVGLLGSYLGQSKNKKDLDALYDATHSPNAPAASGGSGSS